MIRLPQCSLLPVVLVGVLSACTTAPVDRLDDVAAIGALHRRDAEAAKAQDFATLATLMTEDAVSLPPGQPPIVGRAALEQHMNTMRDAMKGAEILDYRFVWNDLEIDGDHAYEWGWIIGKLWTADGKQVDVRYKSLRVLKRDKDGQWRVHRTMWNEAPEARK
jgi:uncharacterized protein (TIGR02246 family)